MAALPHRHPLEADPELLQPEPRPPLHRAERQAEPLGYLRLREAGEVGEREDLVLLPWEGAERFRSRSRRAPGQLSAKASLGWDLGAVASSLSCAPRRVAW